MDKKILLQNLADSLSERTGMTKRKAETFVRSFFEITEEGLLNDGVVKVKGFGTTKIVKVNDRESVNINTGERFQIEGHAKVTFTPDAPFKDLVNRPFAQFTTIVLEDDVDIEELNAVDAAATEPAVATEGAETAEAAEETTVAATEATAEAPAVEAEDPTASAEETPAETLLVAQENAEVEPHTEEAPKAEEEVSTEEEAQAEEEVSTEEEAQAEEEVSTEEEAQAEEETSTEEEPQAEEKTSTEEEAQAADDTVSNDEQAPEDMQQPIIIQNTMPAPPPHNWWRIAFFTLLTILLMVASYFAGYYRIFCPCVNEQPEVIPADTTCTTVPKAPKAQKAVAETPKAETATPAETQTQSKQETAQAQTEQPKETPAPKGPTAAEREAAKKYRQMEGGEYLITGVIETHKMAVGDNLFKLAKKAYGNKDLANYIIFHNRFANPDVIQLGQDIEIPKLTHK